MSRPLDDKHRRELHASGISDAMIEAAGIRSVADGEIKQLLGWNARNEQWGRGYCLPYRTLRGDETGYNRVKLDFPRKDQRGDTVKYESPRRRPNRAYFPPGFEVALADSSAPILITEGEKKALAAQERGFATIGLVGVWGFATRRQRRRTGKPTGPHTLIEDLSTIVWTGRRVFVVFDSDATENRAIRAAEKKLAALLTGRGASVVIVRLPKLGDGKTGLDDFLVRWGAEGRSKLHALLAGAGGHGESTHAKDEGACSTPFALADAFITEVHSHVDGPTLAFWRDEPYVWDGFRPGHFSRPNVSERRDRKCGVTTSTARIRPGPVGMATVP